MVEDRSFENFLRQAFTPSWQKTSRVTARNDATKTFLKEKEDLKVTFQDIPRKVTLT